MWKRDVHTMPHERSSDHVIVDHQITNDCKYVAIRHHEVLYRKRLSGPNAIGFLEHLPALELSGFLFLHQYIVHCYT